MLSLSKNTPAWLSMYPRSRVLSCHPGAAWVQRFYLAQGWQVISTEFRTRPDQLAFWVMGLDLPEN